MIERKETERENERGVSLEFAEEVWMVDNFMAANEREIFYARRQYLQLLNLPTSHCESWKTKIAAEP